MKTKHALVLYLAGLGINILGALFKILHYSGGDQMLVLGSIMQEFGVVLLIYKLWTNPKIKEFLNW